MADVPFSTYQFPATGASANRTLAARLGEIKNVKDYGATGNGVTDDLAAILAAWNWTVSSTRGILYFPPGTYYVSAPIDVSETFVGLRGVMGLSTIVGDFADYIIKHYLVSTGGTGTLYVQKLTLINRNTLGGGIRCGACSAPSVRDCDITANFGINTDNSDTFGPPGGSGAYWASLETAIENCNMRAYTALASDSTGLTRGSDGPTINCTFKDFYIGVRTYGGQGAMNFLGCYFEHCNFGLANSTGPYPNTAGTAPGGATSGLNVLGCHFKNNGIAIAYTSGISRYAGILIEALEGTIPGDPQYGIYQTDGGSCAFEGINITGQYAVAGVHLTGGQPNISPSFWAGISVTNTSTGAGVDWELPTTADSMDFMGCDIADVWTMENLPAKTYTITAATWSGGTATITVAGGHGDLATGHDANVTVAGVTPSGYNGYFTGAHITGAFTFTYTVANPGGSGTVFGTAFLVTTDPGTTAPNVFEGWCFNVSDANTATWGAAATAGSGSNHCKVRFTPAAWTVVGK